METKFTILRLKEASQNWSELAMPTFRISEDVIVSAGDAKSVTSFIVKVEGGVASESDHYHALDTIREEMAYARDEMVNGKDLTCIGEMARG